MADTPPASAQALLPAWARLPLAVGAGVITALGMAPYDLWYLGFAGLVAALWLFRAAPGGMQAIGTGWAVGLGYFGFALGWIVEPFMVDAAATGWMAPFALVGMAGGLALFWALPFWGAGHAGRYSLAVLVTSWAAAELARGYVLTGFPWALVSYIWVPVTPIQWVSVVGPYGLTYATLGIAATFASALWWRNLPRALAGVTALVALFLGGLALTPAAQDPGDRPTVRLIQPNAAQHEKWKRDMIPVFFNRQIGFSEAPPTSGLRAPDLIVWPETALPMLLADAGDALAVVGGAGGGAQMAIGIQREQNGRYYNSLITLGEGGNIGQVYDKHHLVPFGEYMPAAAVFQRWNIFGLASRNICPTCCLHLFGYCLCPGSFLTLEDL